MHGLGPDSALGRELHPKEGTWATRYQTNAILADIYDLLNQLNSNMIAIASRKRSEHPKPYPRPWETNNGHKETKRYGSEPLKVSDLDAWFEERRKDHGRRND